jgi:hypothetical protein
MVGVRALQLMALDAEVRRPAHAARRRLETPRRRGRAPVDVLRLPACDAFAARALRHAGMPSQATPSHAIRDPSARGAAAPGWNGDVPRCDTGRCRCKHRSNIATTTSRVATATSRVATATSSVATAPSRVATATSRVATAAMRRCVATRCALARHVTGAPVATARPCHLSRQATGGLAAVAARNAARAAKVRGAAASGAGAARACAARRVARRPGVLAWRRASAALSPPHLCAVWRRCTPRWTALTASTRRSPRRSGGRRHAGRRQRTH